MFCKDHMTWCESICSRTMKPREQARRSGAEPCDTHTRPGIRDVSSRPGLVRSLMRRKAYFRSAVSDVETKPRDYTVPIFSHWPLEQIK
jgi:hypothetical protein